VSAAYLSMVENGKRNIDRHSLIVALADALGVPPGELAPDMAVKRVRLAARRKAIGFSQEQLAEALRIDRSTVGRWESGETAPQPWMRPRLAKVLQISADQLDDLLAEGRPDSPAEIVSHRSQASDAALDAGNPPLDAEPFQPAKVPNRVLRNVREMERCETRNEFAEAMTRKAHEMGIKAEPSVRYVARLEDGDIKYPHALYRRVLVALCGRPLSELGFTRIPRRQKNSEEHGTAEPADIGIPGPGTDDKDDFRPAVTWLQAARRAQGWSQGRVVWEITNLAARKGMTVSTARSLKTQLSRWENGHITPEYYRPLLRGLFGLTSHQLEAPMIKAALNGDAASDGQDDEMERRTLLQGIAVLGVPPLVRSLTNA